MGKRFALITGASGGIGREIALKLAEENYSLYLHYNSNEEAILKLIEELKQYQVELIPIQADLAALTDTRNWRKIFLPFMPSFLIVAIAIMDSYPTWMSKSLMKWFSCM